MAWAISAPWSLSTSARNKSMPAVTPADVQRRPSWTKIRSGSTSTSGKPPAKSSQ
jgi:hypothetical protein